MKYIYPERYHDLLKSLRLDFDVFDELNDEQLLSLIDALADYISEYGINETGDGENETGTLCADLLTWLAKEGQTESASLESNGTLAVERKNEIKQPQIKRVSHYGPCCV